MRLTAYVAAAVWLLQNAHVARAADPATEEMFGSWHYRTVVSRMDDKRRFSATAGNSTAALSLRCDYIGQNNIYVGVYTTRYIGTFDQSRFIRYRVAGKEASGQVWRFDKDSGNQFDHDKAMQFINYIKDGKTILILVPKYDDSTFDLEVDLTGLDVVLPRLLSDCSGK